jgi:hypothetical protein
MRRFILATVMLLGVTSAARAVDVNPPLHVKWTVTPSHAIEGRVYNDFHTPITKIRLLVEAFDAANRVVGSTYGYVFGDLAPSDSRYFEVRKVPPADHYRVVVESYVQEQFPNGHLGPR